MTGAAVGASEHEPARALRIREHKFLRDHPAHRDSEDMRARRVRMVEYRRDIRRQVAERELDVRLIALAGAAIVDNKNLEPRFHQLQKRLTPSTARAAKSHDQRNRFTLPSSLVAKLEAVFGP